MARNRILSPNGLIARELFFAFGGIKWSFRSIFVYTPGRGFVKRSKSGPDRRVKMVVCARILNRSNRVILHQYIFFIMALHAQ